MTKGKFRLLLIAMWVLSVVAHAAVAFTTSTLPASVQDAVYAEGSLGYPLNILMYALLGYLYLFLFLAATVGLFVFRNWARYLYLACYGAGFILGLVPSITVFTRASYFFGGLFSLASATILALIFLSPVKDYFDGSRADALR